MRAPVATVLLLAAFAATAFLPQGTMASRELMAAGDKARCEDAQTLSWDYVLASGGAELTYQPETRNFLLTLIHAQPTVFFRDNSPHWHGLVVPSRMATTQLAENLAKCNYFGTAILKVRAHTYNSSVTDTRETVIGTLLKLKVYSMVASPCREEVTYTVWPSDLDPKDPSVKKRLSAAVAEGKTTTTFQHPLVFTHTASRNPTGRLGPDEVKPMLEDCRGNKVMADSDSDYCDISQGGGKSYAEGVLDNIEEAAIGAATDALGYAGKLLAIFWPSSGPGSLSLNGLDIWNCISKYVKNYVQGVINEVKLEEIQDSMQGMMALIRDYNNAGSPAERVTKYSEVSTLMVGVLDPRFKDPRYGLPQEVLPYMVQFGTWYTAWRQQEVVNYTAIYNAPDDKPQVKFQALVDAITEYQGLINTSFTAALTWRNDSSQQGTNTDYWTGYDRGCGIGCHCYEIQGYDKMTSWNVDFKFNDCCHERCNYQPQQSDVQRLLDGEKSGAMAQWYITMRLTMASATYWPLLVPGKKLTVGYDLKTYQTMPFGNCGSRTWISACRDDDPLRYSPAAGQTMTGISIWNFNDALTAVEPFFDGQSAGVQGATANCNKQHLDFQDGEGINQLVMWCHNENSYGNAVCTEIAGLQIYTNLGNSIKFGNQDGTPSYQVDFSQYGIPNSSTKKVWACNVSGRLAQYYPPRLTALGFDWCWNEPKLGCSGSGNDCDWTKYSA